jgi:hypothetical protein
MEITPGFSVLRTEDFMKQAAIGFRAHSGWASGVAVCMEGSVPKVLRRERLQLVKTFSYKFRQPYHTAEKLGLGRAINFVDGVREEAEELAQEAIRGVQVALREAGYDLKRGGLLLASGRMLPELEKILASHALIHTADGELFREALRAASGRCGLKLRCSKERELMEECEKGLSVDKEELARKVKEMGREFGAPWTQDEKMATLAGWLALRSS